MAAVNGDAPLSRRPTSEVGQIDDLKQSAKNAANRHSLLSEPIGEMMPEHIDGGNRERRRSSDHQRRSPDHNAPMYGELVVLGTNGSLPCPPISSKMSHRFGLRKQPKATGVSPITRDPKDMDSLTRKSTHTISMAVGKSSVTEYGHDPSSDLFQIGRSADSAIDFVVVESVTGEDGRSMYKSNSTVSRYACRIQCDRRPPYTARLFAAAFDTRGKIQLSSMAPTWRLRTGEHDGLTTNGVAFMRPVGNFESGVSPGEWREVTVNGNVRNLRQQRSSRVPGDHVPEETNILTDGCLIDLCGITLMWRSAIGLEQGPSNTILREHRHSLNEKAPQCPVNFLTLHFKSNSAMSTDLDEACREPWVYLSCGHVYSYHSWKANPSEDNTQRTCPLCRKVGPYTKMDLGQERAFFIDSGPLTHVLVPCGHVTSERTAQYWTSVQIPHLASEWSGRCPFCTTPLDPERPTVKLVFN